MGLYFTETGHNFSDELFIFERMAEGDQRALRYFFDKYYDSLCNYVNLYIRNRSVSEDLVQDIFIYFWEKRGNLKLETSVKSYLFRASRNKYLNYFRDEKCHHTIEMEVSSKSEIYANSNDNTLDLKQLEEVINTSINNLAPRCREVYLLHKNDDLSYKEIAFKMNLSVKTVENQMTIALKKLREQLAPYYEQIFVLILIAVFVK
ncbi:MAG: RNA polymerase sigma-70 factor [Lentimicrobiaceae bacterium]|nr:RNA polymerase sigma-70 factor [Lentimicrobiaceae bacterium]